MKWMLIVVVSIILLGLGAYIVMAVQSQRQPDGLGLQDGPLRPCPDSPNCVCSEAHTQGDSQHAIDALQGDAALWQSLAERLSALGGVIRQREGDYMHVTFTTPVFRYVDDVELRFDRTAGLIQIRSASRIGRSDFGVNRQRVERIRQALTGLGQPHGA